MAPSTRSLLSLDMVVWRVKRREPPLRDRYRCDSGMACGGGMRSCGCCLRCVLRAAPAAVGRRRWQYRAPIARALELDRRQQLHVARLGPPHASCHALGSGSGARARRFSPPATSSPTAGSQARSFRDRRRSGCQSAKARRPARWNRHCGRECPGSPTDRLRGCAPEGRHRHR